MPIPASVLPTTLAALTGSQPTKLNGNGNHDSENYAANNGVSVGAVGGTVMRRTQPDADDDKQNTATLNNNNTTNKNTVTASPDLSKNGDVDVAIPVEVVHHHSTTDDDVVNGKSIKSIDSTRNKQVNNEITLHNGSNTNDNNLIINGQNGLQSLHVNGSKDVDEIVDKSIKNGRPVVVSCPTEEEENGEESTTLNGHVSFSLSCCYYILLDCILFLVSFYNLSARCTCCPPSLTISAGAGGGILYSPVRLKPTTYCFKRQHFIYRGIRS
ncbi:unnamed protein product [Trichobilharzia regenti]|nr:unnamed protein product [Trichobilharzia regenti]